MKNIKENFELILDGLFRLARDFPRCMNYVASILINNQDFCSTPSVKKRIERWCRSTIKTHIRHGHDFEVAWSLVVCGVLKIKLNKDDLDGGGGAVPAPTILALLGLLHEKKLLTTQLSNWPWRAELKKTGIFDQYWLPFYEAVRRGWTNDKVLIRQVNANQVLARMLSANVTFLEDRIFEAAQINISTRIFRSRGARIRTAKSIADYRALKQNSGPRGFGRIKITMADFDY